jgi:transposase
MGQKSGPVKEPAEQLVKEIRRATPAAVFGGGEDPHCADRSARRGQHRRAVPSRRDRPEPLLRLVEGISWAGKKRLAGDTARAATSEEVEELRREASALKEVVAELTLENRLLKKTAIGAGEDEA